MWTPKRVLLLVAGIAVFLTGYEVYAYFLGGIDGLPPLPVVFLPVPPGAPHPPAPPPRESDADRKLRQAFGAECAEATRPIKMDVRSRRMVLATNEVIIGDELDGRVRLNDFSLAIWGNNLGDAAYPEINTIKSDKALLTFDQPVTNPMEMTNRKLIACELQGHITIINNRRTPQRNDDIEVRVLTENTPLFYDDKQNKIWTEGRVELLDTQTKPQPTVIRARGLDLYLNRDGGKANARGGPAPPPRPKTDTISGVDVVELRSNVEMHLWDSGSGLLGNGEKEPKTKTGAAQPTSEDKANAQPAEPQRFQVVITTNGTFRYFVARDLACFDSPKAAAHDPGELPDDQVVVTRVHPQLVAPGDVVALVGHTGLTAELGPLTAVAKLVGARELIDRNQFDTVKCDHLELQFRRKANLDAKAARDDQSSQREIETAFASAWAGKEVELVSEKDALEAHGKELFFFCATAARGPQTVIKGDKDKPMIALKDNNKIKASELHVIAADHKGEGQRAYAKGPGRIDLWDKKSQSYPQHAVWRDVLTSVKEREGDRVYDLLTLLGDAAFVDDEHDQDLSAQRLQVWLEPSERTPAPDTPGQRTEMAAGASSGQRPHKLEAFEHVRTRSPDLLIHDSDHLIVRFKDAPPMEQKLPDTLPPSPPSGAAPAVGPSARDNPTAVNGTPAPQAKPVPPPPSKAKKVIELWGRSVAAYVLRSGARNDVQELVTEGAVHVHQEGSSPEDKGVDIKGETLNLVHHALGDTLIVFGDARGPAELQFGEMFITGPKVTINQKDNTAEVVGVGAMNMPSNTTFEGGKPTKPGTRLTVHWNQYMLFEGKIANFHGGVVAYQEDSSLRCKALEVTLDRVVSFKEGQKGGQQAKVEKLVASLDVYVVDTTRDKEQGGKLVRYQRLVARGLDMNNQDGPVIASGPGRVYILQYGSADDNMSSAGQANPPGAAKPKAAAPGPQKADDQLNLTRIDFGGRMFSNSKAKDRTTKFYDNVEVFHLPADNPDVPVDPDHPPKGGLYLRCNLLTVFNEPLPGGKTNQLMRAERSVSFRTPEFYGTADIVKYNEGRDQIIFEGADGNYATLYQFTGPAAGNRPREIKGRQILYERKTGKLIVDGGKEIIGL